jgi:hypothetical protein
MNHSENETSFMVGDIMVHYIQPNEDKKKEPTKECNSCNDMKEMILSLKKEIAELTLSPDRFHIVESVGKSRNSFRENKTIDFVATKSMNYCSGKGLKQTISQGQKEKSEYNDPKFPTPPLCINRRKDWEAYMEEVSEYYSSTEI